MIDHKDKELFRLATQGVTPLEYDGIRPDPYRNKRGSHAPTPRRPVQNDKSTLLSPLECTHYTLDRSFIPLIDPEATLHFQRGGLSLKQIKKMKQGLISIEDHLDLHGYTLEQAASILNNFLTRVQCQKKRYVRIVHGKGRNPFLRSGKGARTTQGGPPIIKSAVNQWLRKDQRVLAFSSAQPNDGGRGAIYLLLKIKRPNG